MFEHFFALAILAMSCVSERSLQKDIFIKIHTYIQVPMYNLISIPLCGCASGQTSKKSFSRKKEKLSPPFFLSL